MRGIDIIKELREIRRLLESDEAFAEAKGLDKLDALIKGVERDVLYDKYEWEEEK